MLKRANTRRDAKAWAQFWDEEGSGAHIVNTDADAAALRAVWQVFLDAGMSGRDLVRVVDVACGSAVVAAQAIEVATNRRLPVHPICCDYSASAVAAARGRKATLSACGVAADAAVLPFADQSIDLMVSQYGVEYAGEQAFSEMARVLAPGGFVQAIVHQQGGVIDQRCRSDRALLVATIKSSLLRNLFILLKMHHKSLALGRSLPAVAAAEKRFRTSAATVRAALGQSQEGAAQAHVGRLLGDAEQAAQSWRAYGLEAMERWTGAQQSALDGFARRMESMTQAALDEAAISGRAALFREHGLEDVSVMPFRPGHHPIGAGWILYGRR